MAECRKRQIEQESRERTKERKKSKRKRVELEKAIDDNKSKSVNDNDIGNKRITQEVHEKEMDEEQVLDFLRKKRVRGRGGVGSLQNEVGPFQYEIPDEVLKRDDQKFLRQLGPFLSEDQNLLSSNKKKKKKKHKKKRKNESCDE
eukprot:TRINITY_DN35825_c0_g1_i1.p2 TRINITY_DN35825_c0_g1~~TRINITY_DN35825_c0_g1_i1.p2  ORF type:complete len:145 (-),score=28.93 TRINITY_DN35825_c0_g1_i1:166-600(-)